MFRSPTAVWRYLAQFGALSLAFSCTAFTGCAAAGSEVPRGSFEVSESAFSGGLLLSVTEAQGEVWAVGGRPGKTAILRRDAEKFVPVANPGKQTAWWICELGSDLAVVGEGGMILVYRGGNFETIDLSVTSTFYGCVGESKDDFWIVGGDPLAGPPELIQVVNGEGRAPELGVNTAELPKVFFKIEQVDKELFIVGDAGTVLHRDERGDWMMQSLGRDPLFTVSALSADDVWTVGGRNSGLVFHFDGKTWERQMSPGVPGLFGVSATPESVVAVGHSGTIIEYERGSTDADGQGQWLDRTGATDQVLHAVWQGEDGRAWAVGGNVFEQSNSAWRGVVVAR